MAINRLRNLSDRINHTSDVIDATSRRIVTLSTIKEVVIDTFGVKHNFNFSFKTYADNLQVILSLRIMEEFDESEGNLWRTL